MTYDLCAIKEYENTTFTGKWDKMKILKLSKINQSKGKKYHVLSLISRI